MPHKLYALPPAYRCLCWALLLAALAAVQGLLCAWAGESAHRNQTTGLRFAQPLTQAQIKAVYEMPPETAGGITASFWGQTTGTVTAEPARRAEGVVCIAYCGSADDCLPVLYENGTAPGAVGRQCAVSAGLARQLFGSADVVGLAVVHGRERYHISGVFRAEDAVLLYPGTGGYTCAELRGVSADTPKADAEQWCAAAGLGAPQCIVYGPQRAWLASVVSCLPLALCVLGGAFLLLRASLRWPPLSRQGAWLAGALALACLLPAALQALPGWLIPARWSDFSFWERLVEQIRTADHAWQAAVRYWRDIAL